MEKIIQIAIEPDNMFCLTEDGKVYYRKIESKTENKKTFYTRKWVEVPEVEEWQEASNIPF